MKNLLLAHADHRVEEAKGEIFLIKQGPSNLFVIRVEPVIAEDDRLLRVHLHKVPDVFENKPLNALKRRLLGLRAILGILVGVEGLVCVRRELDVGTAFDELLYFLQPLKHVCLDRFYLEKQAETPLVVAQPLLQDDTKLEKWR